MKESNKSKQCKHVRVCLFYARASDVHAALLYTWPAEHQIVCYCVQTCMHGFVPAIIDACIRLYHAYMEYTRASMHKLLITHKFGLFSLTSVNFHTCTHTTENRRAWLLVAQGGKGCLHGHTRIRVSCASSAVASPLCSNYSNTKLRFPVLVCEFHSLCLCLSLCPWYAFYHPGMTDVNHAPWYAFYHAGMTDVNHAHCMCACLPQAYACTCA